VPASRILCNLDFQVTEDFRPFTVQGYRFKPIPERQPRRLLRVTPQDMMNRYLRHSRNATVTLPPSQPQSVLRRGGLQTRHRHVVLLYDLAVLASLLIGRNVIQASVLKETGLPVTAGNRCQTVAHDSAELEAMMTTALGHLLDGEWQRKYQMGFHLVKLYHTSSLNVMEPRFLASMVIWEFLYAVELMDPGRDPVEYYDTLRKTRLLTKLCVCARTNLLRSGNLKKDRLRVFVHLRDQLTHYGRLPVTIPHAPDWLKGLGIDGYEQYMGFLCTLTQIAVLNTLFDAWPHLKILNVQDHADELFATGRIARFG
jgi:hypothetical protein